MKWPTSYKPEDYRRVANEVLQIADTPGIEEVDTLGLGEAAHMLELAASFIEAIKPKPEQAVGDGADLLQLIRDARHRICNDAPSGIGKRPFDDPVYGPPLRRLDAADAALATQPKPEQAVGDGVAVRWEARRRNRFTGEWGSWQGCDPDTEETVARESVPDEWEFRTLYTAPRPAAATPAEVTEDPYTGAFNRWWDEHRATHSVNVHIKGLAIAAWIAGRNAALAAQPSAVGVPEELDIADAGFNGADERERGYVEGWNACRKSLIATTPEPTHD